MAGKEGLNRVILIGNLTRDPEVRNTPSGVAVGDLRLAVNRRFRTGDGQDREETCYVDVTVWARTAENCAQYLRKGSPIFVEGRLKLDEWEKDGKKNSRLGVVAERVLFLGTPSRGTDRGSGETGGEPFPAPTGGGAAGGHDAAPPPGPGGGEGDDENLPF